MCTHCLLPHCVFFLLKFLSNKITCKNVHCLQTFSMKKWRSGSGLPKFWWSCCGLFQHTILRSMCIVSWIFWEIFSWCAFQHQVKIHSLKNHHNDIVFIQKVKHSRKAWNNGNIGNIGNIGNFGYGYFNLKSKGTRNIGSVRNISNKLGLSCAKLSRSWC